MDPRTDDPGRSSGWVWSLRIGAALLSLLTLGVLALARLLGAHWNLLLVIWVVAWLPGLGLRLVAWRWGWLELSLYRGRDRSAHLALIAALVRALSWALGAAAIWVALIPIQFSADELWTIRLLVVFLGASSVAGALIPVRRRQWTTTAAIGAIGAIFAMDLIRGLAPPPQPTVELRSPFAEPAYVFHGGGSPLLNHHAGIQQQRHALDLVLAPGGSERIGDPTRPEGYACFGADILAPADGRIVSVRDDRPDLPPGEVDTEVITGNTVVLELAPERYVLLAHLQQGSASVHEGQQVRAGDRIAACGNTGNTSQPHLHLQVQDRPTFSNDDPQLHTFGIRWDRRRRAGREASGAHARRNDTLLPGPRP